MSTYVKRLIGYEKSSFKIVVLSEGYLNENDFKQDLFLLRKRLLNYYPFTRLSHENNNISLYTSFQLSSNSGCPETIINVIKKKFDDVISINCLGNKLNKELKISSLIKQALAI